MTKYDPEYIDPEEKKLIESINKMDTRTIAGPTPQENRATKVAARQYLARQETKMNIRIDPEELKRIKERAAQEGLKYQALVKSVLHKYITGQLVEKKR